MERLGAPLLIYRDGTTSSGSLRSRRTAASSGSAAAPPPTSAFAGDSEVSKLHAQVEHVGSDCTLVDDGLSRNGSFVNEERVSGRRMLRDGDVIRVGRTRIRFRSPGAGGDSTVISTDLAAAAGVSPAQRRVLVALCRPFKDGAAVRQPRDERRHRRRASPQHRRRQDPPAGAVREVRPRRRAAEPQAGRPRPAGDADGPDHRARPLTEPPPAASRSTKRPRFRRFVHLAVGGRLSRSRRRDRSGRPDRRSRW